jgi:hypothetical protein
MNKRFETVARIETRELYDSIAAYGDALINEATALGLMSDIEVENEYTLEIGRTICLCADYERDYMYFEHLDPLNDPDKLRLPRRRLRRLHRIPSRRRVAVSV